MSSWRTRSPAARLLNKAKERARNAGTEFTITLKDIEEAWPPSGLCPALHLRLRSGVGKVIPESPTLDRLDTAFGYVPGNVAVISRQANIIKNNGTARELELIAKWMRSQGLD